VIGLAGFTLAPPDRSLVCDPDRDDKPWRTTMPDDLPQADAPASADPATAADAPIAFVLSVLQALSEMATLEGQVEDAIPAGTRGDGAARPLPDLRPAAQLTQGGSVEPTVEVISQGQGSPRANAVGLVAVAANARLAPDSSWSSWSVTALERAVARLGIAVPCLVAPPARYH
jgi:hypothetical protein